ncbi:MAG: hypothetical protein HXX19_14645 [Rhodoferax sp.]|nr:hypothetical protein [Rhodoferax sp.]
MQKELGGVPTQFINDLDPYIGRPTIPIPVAVEVNTDSAWQDFQDTSARMDAEYSETQLGELFG